jgi:hypothetical protein
MDFTNDIATKTAKGYTWAGVHGYQNSAGETSDYVVGVGFSYLNMVAASFAILSNFAPSDEVSAQACAEMLASYSKSLNDVGSTDWSNEQAYLYAFDASGMVLPSLKWHRETGVLYLAGRCRTKRVTVAGPAKKPVKSSALTLAKRAVAEQLDLPVRHYVSFKLAPGSFESIRIGGETLTLDE